VSLGDYLRLLRARRGGITPMEIEQKTGLPPGLYRYMEQRYRSVGDDDSIRTLADFFGESFDDLRWRLDWPRKELSRAIAAAAKADAPITLFLWDGRNASGKVVWWDLGALMLESEQGDRQVIQRHAVERWDPRAPEPAIETEDNDQADD
jgi:sRNA-binding regulator protein Hfq